MKKHLQLSVLTLLLTAASFAALAQDAPSPAKHKTPRWVSDKGYWVVESNINDRDHSCVYFYNNNNTLIHKETIAGVRLSPDKTRTKMKLKKALEKVVDAWTTGNHGDTPQNVVAALFK